MSTMKATFTPAAEMKVSAPKLQLLTPIGDWLDIERAPLLALQPTPSPTATIEAAPAAVPSPAATVERPVEAGQSVSSDGCPAEIVQVFGERAPQACAVAFCESRWDPHVIGDQGASLSWFQIQPRWHQEKADALFGAGANLLDPAVNVATAYVISRGGADWSQWTCGWAAYR